MSAEKVVVSAVELTDLVSRIFAAHGMAPPAARQAADVLVWADAGGHASHGVSRVPTYLRFVQAGDLDPAAVPEVTMDAGAVFRMDARGCAGPVALNGALALSRAKAEAHGVSFGVVANTTHIGAAGYYAMKLTEAGLISIIMTAGVPLMAYHGATIASVATAPLTIGVPAGERAPLLLDMASSVVALGKIRQALTRGEALQPGWALDRNGEPTTDPAAAEVPLPLGGPKGSGLALMFECIAGVLGGAPILAAALAGSGKGPHKQSPAVIALDVKQFRPLEAFTRDVEELVGALKALPRAAGITEILMPGERSQQQRLRATRDGIVLRAELWAELREIDANPGLSPG